MDVRETPRVSCGGSAVSSVAPVSEPHPCFGQVQQLHALQLCDASTLETLHFKSPFRASVFFRTINLLDILVPIK